MNDIINEIFEMEVITKISNICDSFEITDNNLRADEIMDVLSDYDFKELGCGTNRICVKKKGYPYAIKIALDGRGIMDNNIEFNIFNDPELREHNDVTLSYENSGLILLSQKVPTMKSEDFEYFKKDIYKILKRLSKTYILNDIGPRSFKNWGIFNEKPIIIDFAYLSRVKDAKIKVCNKCSGKLHYTTDFIQMQCEDCGKLFNLADISGSSYIDPLTEEGWV